MKNTFFDFSKALSSRLIPRVASGERQAAEQVEPDGKLGDVEAGEFDGAGSFVGMAGSAAGSVPENKLTVEKQGQTTQSLPPMPPPKVSRRNWVSSRFQQMFSPVAQRRPVVSQTPLGEVPPSPNQTNRNSFDDDNRSWDPSQAFPNEVAISEHFRQKVEDETTLSPKKFEFSFAREKAQKRIRQRNMLLGVVAVISLVLIIGLAVGLQEAEVSGDSGDTDDDNNDPFPALFGDQFVATFETDDGSFNQLGSTNGNEFQINDPDGSPITLITACGTSPVTCLTVFYENGLVLSSGPCPVCDNLVTMRHPTQAKLTGLEISTSNVEDEEKITKLFVKVESQPDSTDAESMEVGESDVVNETVAILDLSEQEVELRGFFGFHDEGAIVGLGAILANIETN